MLHTPFLFPCMHSADATVYFTILTWRGSHYISHHARPHYNNTVQQRVCPWLYLLPWSHIHCISFHCIIFHYRWVCWPFQDRSLVGCEGSTQGPVGRSESRAHIPSNRRRKGRQSHTGIGYKFRAGSVGTCRWEGAERRGQGTIRGVSRLTTSEGRVNERQHHPLQRGVCMCACMISKSLPTVYNQSINTYTYTCTCTTYCILQQNSQWLIQSLYQLLRLHVHL